eukprot:1136208-Pelagomonas_calceolata.AAC.1
MCGGVRTLTAAVLDTRGYEEAAGVEGADTQVGLLTEKRASAAAGVAMSLERAEVAVKRGVGVTAAGGGAGAGGDGMTEELGGKGRRMASFGAACDGDAAGGGGGCEGGTTVVDGDATEGG